MNKSKLRAEGAVFHLPASRNILGVVEQMPNDGLRPIRMLLGTPRRWQSLTEGYVC
jgi:hypothetical protein